MDATPTGRGGGQHSADYYAHPLRSSERQRHPTHQYSERPHGAHQV